MAACTGTPTSVNGANILTSSPYNDGDLVVYQCTSGYVMSGTPYVTCNSGTFTGTYPTCTLQDTNSVTVNLSQDSIPTWLIYLLAAILGLIMILILTCLLVWCCQLFGCYGRGGLFGAPNSGGGVLCCRKKNVYEEEQYQKEGRQCTIFPRRYLYDDHGRRFHYDDYGRRCFYNHKHQNNTLNGKTMVTPISDKEDEAVTVVSEADNKKVQAKVLSVWKPHANPVRNINTSTK